jgi:hypothetical protein
MADNAARPAPPSRRRRLAALTTASAALCIAAIAAEGRTGFGRKLLTRTRIETLLGAAKQQRRRGSNYSKKTSSSSFIHPRTLEDQANQQGEGNNDGNQQQNGGDDQQDDFYKYVGDDKANNADDAVANNAVDDLTDDAAAQQANRQDDFFDDKLADDQYADDDQTVLWDDFYAYKDDWKPPNVMPLTARKMIAYALIVVASTLGASGGIGGGGIVVPVYILVMALPLKVAVPVGAATVLGGAIGSTLVNLQRRHPLADRPLIDFDLVLVMEPLTLVGTLLGTIFHRTLSEKFLVILLVMLLSITAHTTLTKAMRMYHAEKRYIRHLKAAQAPPPSGTPPGGAAGYAAWTDEQHDYQTDEQIQELRPEERQRILILNPDYVTIRSDLAQQEKFTPRTKILALSGMMFVLTFLNINPWGIRCGSLAYYTNYVVMIAYLVSCAWAAQTYVVARHEIKELVRFDYVHGDIKWNAKAAVVYPASEYMRKANTTNRCVI